MKSISFISFLFFVFLFSACAEKKEVFDPAAAFGMAEEKMQKGDYENARKGYQEIQEKSPERTYEPALMLRIADTYYGEEKYEEALVEYRSFLNYHPANKEAAYVQYQIAMCNYMRLSTIDRDPEMTRTALREFQTLLAKFPKSVYEKEAREGIALCSDLLAQYEMYVAQFYQRKGNLRVAIVRYEKLLADYPGSTVEKDALYEAAKASLTLGEREKARSLAETLVQKYPAMADKAAPLLGQPGTAAR